ncbi:MAG: alkaline phosphatase family protein [Planctomycetota bacterium]|nr:alkaline phosphatase family protein [Planctomycetota bacterium]
MSRTLLAVLLAAVAASGQTPRRKVLIIGIDGCRPDAIAVANTPNLDTLIANGAYSDLAQTGITVSAPGWSDMLCGVWENKHGVTNNSFSGMNYGQYPHLFRRVKEACSQSFLSSFVSWSPINTFITPPETDLIVSVSSDLAVLQAALAHLANDDPDLSFVYFGDVDLAGHGYGFDPSVPQYIATIEVTDTYIGQLLMALQSRPTYAQEEWLILMSSDHGGSFAGHGQQIPSHMTVPFLVSGAATQQGTVITPAPEVVDLPPTIFAFLGLPVDPAWGWDGQAVGLAAPPYAGSFPCVSCTRDLGARPRHALGRVDLIWTSQPPSDATGYELRRDGVLVATLATTASSWQDTIGAPSGAHSDLHYELTTVGGPIASSCPPLEVRCLLSGGAVALADDFEDYADDAAMQSAGWLAQDVNNPVESSTWTVTNPGNRAGPPGLRGGVRPGRMVVSDSDLGGGGGGNPPGSGMSHDLWTPVFSCAGMAAPWLHFDCAAFLNNNGEAVFDVDVSIDNGGSWSNVLRRVAQSRTGAAPVVTTSNADGPLGPLHLDLTPWAANQASVRVRFRHFEPNWDWWIAVDNVLVDDVPYAGGSVTLMPNEDFSSGIPPTWTVSGLNSGANTWTTSDPCSRSVASNGGAFPYLGGRAVARLGTAFAILDSDCDPDPAEDEHLITPPIDASAYADVWLHFRSEILFDGDMQPDVLVSLDGGQTFLPTPLFSWPRAAILPGEDPLFMEHVLHVPEAAGQPAVAFAFRFQSLGNTWWWAVDDVRVTGEGAASASSTMIGSGCSAAAPHPGLYAMPPVLGQTAVIYGNYGPSSAPGSLGISDIPAQPFSVAAGCTIYLDFAQFATWTMLPFTTDPAGTWSFLMAIPADPSLAGYSVALQAGFPTSASPFGYDLTNGLHAVLGF